MDSHEQIQRAKDFLDEVYEKKINDILSKGQSTLVIDFAELIKHDPEMSDEVLESPEETIRGFELAMEGYETKNFKVRFTNLPQAQYIAIRNIRSPHLDKLMYIEGIVRQSSDVRPQVTSARFECPSCGNTITILQIETRFKEPTRCTCGRRGKFRLLSKDLVDAQRLVLEESPESLEGGEQPKRLSVFLKEDLVEPKMERKTTPGSKVRVYGIVKEVPIILRTGAQSIRYDLMMDSNFIEPIDEAYQDIEINPEEEKEILDLSKSERLYENFIQSIAPSIYGHEDIKEAILLQLMGGVRKQKEDGTTTRGDIHILLCGDPGSGKSQLLTFVAKLAPKARFVSGKGASGAGISASVVKDEFLKGWALEAGALVLANNGICCLHPQTQIINNNTLQPISKLFNKNKKIFGKCNTELVEISQVQVDSFGFDLRELETKKIKSPLIRRKRYEGKLIELRFTSGFRIKLTPDHPLINGNNLKWKTAGKFKTGDKILAPLKLPDNNKEILIFDLIPNNWKIFLNKEEKEELKQTIKKGFKTLSEFNRKFSIDKNFISGGLQLTKQKFTEVINYFQIGDYWKRKPLKYGRVSNGERLKITRITPELAYILGFIHGDGHVCINKRRTSILITQSAAHKEYVNELKRCWSIISSKNLPEYKFKREVILDNKKITVQYNNLGIGSNLIGELYSIYTKNSLQNLISLPTESLKGFIAGLMDSDGCISKKHCTKNGKKYYTQNIQFLFSNNLRDNLNFLIALRRLDCYGNVKENLKSKIKAVVVSGRSDIDCMIKELKGFSVKIRKTKFLEKRIDISCFSDKIPRMVTGGLCTKISKLNKSYLINKGVWSSIYDFKHMKREPSRKQLLKIITRTRDKIDHETISSALNLIKRDYFLDKIIKIKKHKYKGYVYDLYVPEKHNFFADGIIVHNCIDELDKMTVEDTSAMHEAMEQQRISISKANIQATLNSRTTVLAAANPKLGRFDPYAPIASQIDLPPALINRFDLIFPVRDIPNKEKDKLIASHVLKLQQKPSELKSEVPPKLFRKYISYTKNRVNPVLTDAAVDEIMTFYVELRNSGTTGEEGIRPIPISARQLEALVRLAEGSARVRLSKKVTREDSKRSIRLLKHCLMQVGIDPETGQIDIDRISTGISSSQRSRIVALREIIFSLDKKLGKDIPIEEIIAEAAEKGIDEVHVQEAIEKLKREGEIFEPKSGHISKM